MKTGRRILSGERTLAFVGECDHNRAGVSGFARTKMISVWIGAG